jgi:hypothetical protein
MDSPRLVEILVSKGETAAHQRGAQSHRTLMLDPR